MKIKSTKFIREAEETTDNARYELVYTVAGDILQSVIATVFDKIKVAVPGGVDGSPAEQEVEQQIGVLYLENGVMRPNAPFPYSSKYHLYIADFTNIINEITNPSGKQTDE